MRSRKPWVAEETTFERNAGSAVCNVHNRRTLLGIPDLSRERGNGWTKRARTFFTVEQP